MGIFQVDKRGAGFLVLRQAQDEEVYRKGVLTLDVASS